MPERGARPRSRRTAEDWARAALAAIADGGLAAVAVEGLAVRLGTTKGSFYWHFANRDALLRAALDLWERETTATILREVHQAVLDPAGQLRLLIIRVVALVERDRVELALMSSANHPVVRPALSRVTRNRLDGVVTLFTNLGFPPEQARSRALLAYSAYLGHAQLAHSAPEVLPREKADRAEYLDQVMSTLTAPPP